MKAILVLDDAVGETRRALLDEDGRAFRLDVERWSERETRARAGEIWRGVVRALAPGSLGWFVDLGTGGHGLLESAKGLSLAEGAWVAGRVKAEGGPRKGAVLAHVAPPAKATAPAGAGRWLPAAEDAFLAGVEIEERIEGARARALLDATIEEAEAGEARLPGGGNISIEVTRGMVAIDVDAADRKGDVAGFSVALNREALEEAARQLALRGASGPVVIDFLRMRETAQRNEITDSLRKAVRRRIESRCDVLGISPLGLTEALIPRTRRSLAEAMAMTPAAEREALIVLRQIEEIGWAHRGSRIRARVSPGCAAWLAQDLIGWQSTLAGRIGWRWLIESVDRGGRGPDVGIDG